MVRRPLEEPLATVASEAHTAVADLIFPELRNKSANFCIKFYLQQVKILFLSC